MTREEFRDYVDFLRSQDEISYDVYSALIDGIDTLEQEPYEDCISRKTLLNKIKEVCFSRKQEWVNFRVSQGSNGQRDFLINYIEQLQSVKPQEPKWISVSEKLPEEDTAVLIWCPERRNIYCAYLEEKQWWIFGAYFQKVPLEVIAWMPLPKPYEPQKGAIRNDI